MTLPAPIDPLDIPLEPAAFAKFAKVSERYARRNWRTIPGAIRNGNRLTFHPRTYLAKKTRNA